MNEFLCILYHNTVFSMTVKPRKSQQNILRTDAAVKKVIALTNKKYYRDSRNKVIHTQMNKNR